MVNNSHKAIEDVEMSLQSLPSVVLDKLFEQYDAFLMPQVISSYGNLYKYTAQIILSVSTTLNDMEQSHAAPPCNAWSQGPPKNSRATTNTQKSTTAVTLSSG
eukprot:1813258-Ditylum_brightwellii.AAC.1